MTTKALHITNGNSLTDYLKELGFKEDILTWKEMLCEGPVIPKIDCDEFFSLRRDFLNHYYNVDFKDYNFQNDLKLLTASSNFTEINLWFDYDLFCHINLLGAINFIHQKQIDVPIYLISSGRIKNETNLMNLTELSAKQIKKKYKKRVRLNTEDLELAIALWRTYCGTDHNIFKSYITKNSSFPYLTNCLKAHLKRFPNQKSGLDSMEENILKLIKDSDIKSQHHLLGYALNYQGFYGYGDIQIKRMIKNLELFFNVTDSGLTLNRKGHEALLGQHNFSSEINNNIVYGGVKRLDFQFSTDQNKLIKTITHVN
jgi:hypothetical protein